MRLEHDTLAIENLDHIHFPFEAEKDAKQDIDALNKLVDQLIKTIASNAKQEEQKHQDDATAVKTVLSRSLEDKAIWNALFNTNSAALSEFNLSSEALAALFCGDVNWVKSHAPEVTEKEMTFLYSRLEVEAW